MRQKNILFLGYGDIAARTCGRLSNYALTAVSRSVKPLEPGVEHIQGAADAPVVLTALKQKKWDVAIITLTPTEPSDDAYKMAYVDTLRALVDFWKEGNAPRLILFASSTSVYGQNDGSWVDEDSEAAGESFMAKRLLEAEGLLKASGLKHCIVRFAGIYGPGRDFLIRQVKEGKGGNDNYTNRIHADDCAGVLAHLTNLFLTKKPLKPVYVACDSKPAPGMEVRQWLADKMGLGRASLTPSESSRGGNKRCSNHLLLASGYRFLYSSYKDGYKNLVP